MSHIASRTTDWTFLTNHSHVLICIYRDPEMRLRDVAERVGITERAVHRIVKDLEASAVLIKTKEGRRNRYEIDVNHALRHPVEGQRLVSDLLQLAT